jgi:hypothetical protein
VNDRNKYKFYSEVTEFLQNSEFRIQNSSVFKNAKMEIYEAIISLVYLYECETWSLIQSDEHHLRIFVYENNTRTKHREKTCIMMNFIISNTYLMQLARLNTSVCGYGLNEQAIEVRSPAEAKGFFL